MLQSSASQTALHSIKKPSDVTTEWLSAALGIEPGFDFTFSRVGQGQVSECYRFALDYDGVQTGPTSVILKVASQDESSAHAGVSLGLYERKVLFYQQIAPQFRNMIPHPFETSYDGGSFALLLTDMSPAKSGDDVVGATLEQAQSCVKALGQIQRQILRDGVDKYTWLKRGPMMNQASFQSLFDGFVARYKDLLTVEELSLCSRLVSCYDAYLEQASELCVQGLAHGDFRLDNILFQDDACQTMAAVVDWQTVFWGPVMMDLAYFLGGSLSRDLRRAHWTELVEIYHQSLGSTTLTMDQCMSDIRHQSFAGIVMAISSSMLVQRTERGDEMFMTMIKRHCDFVGDLDALAILPPPKQLPILSPLREDEALHPRTSEALFNESYYFDFVDQEQGIAGYVRLGITPNVADGGWYLAVLCRRGKPMVSIMDYASPLAGESLTVRGKSYEAHHQVVEPLQIMRIILKGTAKVHASEESVFRDQAEETIDLFFDLTFHTDSTPYQYRVTTRYEIGCRVDGLVSVGSERATISRQFGQRDHSWGVRNWWNMDWYWGSIHLDDGSHIHLIDVYIAGGHGRLCVGYYQAAGEDMLDLGEIETKWETDAETQLVTGSTLSFTPKTMGKMTAEVEPLGHGPLRLVSDEGKVALFDRAWCKFTLDDGRVGYGWSEWNRVQH